MVTDVLLHSHLEQLYLVKSWVCSANGWMAQMTQLSATGSKTARGKHHICDCGRYRKLNKSQTATNKYQLTVYHGQNPKFYVLCTMKLYYVSSRYPVIAVLRDRSMNSQCKCLVEESAVTVCSFFN